MHGDDDAELEGEGEAIYGAANADPSEPPGPVALALALLREEEGEQLVWNTDPGSRLAEWNAATKRMKVRRCINRIARASCLGHEISEYWCDRTRAFRSDRENWCDRLAPRLLAPQRAFLYALRWVGLELKQLADTFCMSQTMTALRIAEVQQRPVVVVMPGQIIGRGPAWQWGDREIVLRMMADGELPLPRGVQRYELTDAVRRVALIGE